MKNLLNKISEAGLLVKMEKGELQIFSTKNDVDESLIAEIKERKPELISYLNKQDNSSIQKSKYTEIPKCNEKDGYPLSNAQMRIWLASQMEKESVVYNMPSMVILDGTYNIPSFKQAVCAAIKRHEILRTIFKVDDSGDVKQHIVSYEDLKFEINYIDYRDLEDNEPAWKEYVSQDANKTFHLNEGPLLRASLIHLTKDKYIFYYNMHHIISDEWSSNILTRDILELYNSFNSGSDPEINTLRIQYKDYATWQLEQLEQDSYREHSAYWTNRLSGGIPKIDLPSSKIRPSYKTASGENLMTYLPKIITEELQHFLKSNEGSLFIVLLSLINVLIYKYTSEKSIIIGSPFAGRGHPDLEDQIGFYLNNLAIKNTLNPELNFIEFYNEVKKNCLEDFSHQEYPIDKIIDDLGIKSDHSRTPLFDISITLHEETAVTATNNVDTEAIIEKENPSGLITSKNDIEFHFTKKGEVISFDLVFNNDVYEANMIARLMHDFKKLARSVLSAPKQPLKNINYLNDDERNELINTFNDTSVDFEVTGTLIDAFVTQMKKSPDATALIYKDTSLTYQELHTRSSELANYMISEYNVSKGDFIGVHLNRSENYIISLLAILKSGAIYVPIDTNYPDARKKYIIKDAGIDLMISDTSYMFELDYFEGTILPLDMKFKITDVDSDYYYKTDPSNVAYVIYTSGSTGNPKGVVIDHKTILNTIESQIDIFGVNAEMNSLQFASFSFDASISEIFITLLAGAKLHIAADDIRNDPRSLGEYILKENIDIATIPPSFFLLMEKKSLENFKVLITAGESPDLKKVLSYISYGGAYFNAYGPTETSICASIFKLNVKEEIKGIKAVPIGTPIANTTIYILDEFNKLKSKGTIGEICVGGSGLARGYLNQPELTKEKFIEHPFIEGERLYKTGDLGRWLPNGNLEFKGREDHQVKISGYRIELEEIESQLNEIEFIKQSVVLSREDITATKQLVAYLVCNTDVNLAKIKKSLAKRLPDYMVPKMYVLLEKFPLNHNGKIDRKALPVPNDSSYNKRNHIEPSNETERTLANIWQEILGLDKVSANDNFFELGGSSLLAVKLSFAITKVFEQKIAIDTIFKYPTLQAQAQFIEILDVETNEFEDEEVIHI